jgi:O-methyltransferase involved in polyketide biosynthesis
LLGAGLDPAQPVCFVWEGVSMYLRSAAVRGVLDDAAALTAAGGELVCDFWYDAPELDRVSGLLNRARHGLHVFGEPVYFGLHPRELRAFSAGLGWEAGAPVLARDLRARYLGQRKTLLYGGCYLAHLERRG